MTAESTALTLGQAEVLARSSLLPPSLQGKGADVLMICLTGRDLGLSPTASLQLIHVVQGRPVISGALMLALLRRAGHRVTCLESSEQRAAFRGIHHNGDVVEVEFTSDDADRAGLAKKAGPWQQYPRAMLYWRAASMLCRQLDAACVGGLVYTAADFDALPESDRVVTVEGGDANTAQTDVGTDVTTEPLDLPVTSEPGATGTVDLPFDPENPRPIARLRP